MSKLTYQDKINIYIERKQGNSIVNISKKAREKIGGRVLNINVSISHNKSNAIAFAIVEE